MQKTKKRNLFDILILLSILFSFSGYSLAQNNKTPLNKIIKGKEDIGITVYIPEVNHPETNLLKPGESTGITIRNRPYEKLKILDVRMNDKLLVLPDNSGSPRIIKDPLRKHIKDYFVTLSDHALITDDGYSIGGNKIKIGNEIELEGFNYRLKGKVIDVFPENKLPEKIKLLEHLKLEDIK